MSNNTIILETEQIHNAIVRKLTTAQKKIQICVAWFTCKAFSTVLIDRLKKVKIEILISDHDFNRKANHFNTLLKYENCSLHVFPSTKEKFMHNKFCCIDDTIIITGSYNWSDKAETNYENILIIENPIIAQQYKDYFDKIKAEAIEVKDWKQHFGHFISNNEISLKENDASDAAISFEKKIIENMHIARKFIKVNFEKIEENIRLYSAVGAARIYCNEPEIQSGLAQLRDKNELRLSFEWLVLQPEYASLFSTITKNTAREKLRKCQYVFPEYMQQL